jgi:predicted dehydrogenase
MQEKIYKQTLKMLSKDKNYYLLIGYGSIAKKHITIIKKNDPASIIYVYIKNKKLINDLKVKKFIFTLDHDFIKKINFVYVLSPSTSHKYYLDFFIKYKHLKIFIEKPLFNRFVNDNFSSSKYFKNSRRIFIGYNMRYMENLKFLKKYIKDKKILSVVVNTTSNLKYWRKTAYNKSVSSSKKLGGGIILELSHEFDYLTYLFGKLNTSFSSFKKASNLDINVEDTINANFQCKNFEIHLYMNMFSFFQERVIKVFLNNETVICDLNEGTTKIFYKNYKLKKINKFPNDLKSSYTKQFISFKDNKNSFFKRCTIKNAFNVMHLIRAINLKNNNMKSLYK